MGKRGRVFAVVITLGVLVGLIASLYMFTDWFSNVTGYTIGSSQQEQIALCLAQEHVEYYSSINCSACNLEAQAFGNSFYKVPQVSCSDPGVNCGNLKETPAWYINGSVYYGYQNLSELGKLSGC